MLFYFAVPASGSTGTRKGSLFPSTGKRKGPLFPADTQLSKRRRQQLNDCHQGSYEYNLLNT